MRRKEYPLIEADVTGLAFGGRGIARVDGMAVFVDQAVPGDRAVIQFTRRKKNFAEARLVDILSPSADRVAAPAGTAAFAAGAPGSSCAIKNS
jgi:23S rRNA (uracil1939-C5)-methyltransferase